jgi:hypothetical protein
VHRRIEHFFKNHFNPICDRSDEKTKSDYCFFGKSETILAVLRLNELVTLCLHQAKGDVYHLAAACKAHPLATALHKLSPKL